MRRTIYGRFWHIVLLFCLPLSLAACSTLARADAPPPVLYLGWDDAGVTQIFRVAVGEAAQQVTTQATDVFDFAIAPDASQVAYALLAPDGSGAIWLMAADGGNARELLACPEAKCTHLVWAPDGRRLIYERREADAPGVPRLWWLDTKTGETITVLEDGDAVSSGARFSPDGEWITYLGSPDQGVMAYRFADGRHLQLPGEMGTPAIWSPDGESLLLRNQDLYVLHGDEGEDHLAHSHDFLLSVYLYRADLDGRSRVQLSGSGEVDDANPAWSPDGEWIAFGRTKPRTGAGRQLWLMRADGSEARALTDDLSISFGPPSWSPDGRYLLFQRFDMAASAAEPAIWLMELETGAMSEIAGSGMQPAWLAPIGGS